MQNIPFFLRKIIVILFLFIPFCFGSLDAEQKIVRMESRTFPNPIVWDSNYTALLVASDGRVYVGLCTIQRPTA